MRKTFNKPNKLISVQFNSIYQTNTCNNNNNNKKKKCFI